MSPLMAIGLGMAGGVILLGVAIADGLGWIGDLIERSGK